MGLRVVFVAAECEPHAKVGGLGDVVDALARALGRLPAPAALDGPVEVFLPAYRGLTGLATGSVTVPDPISASRASDVTVRETEASGYRLTLIDHPPAFDRPGIYGDAGGADYPDNAWRFGLFCRAVLEVLRADARPVDVIHAHDWHACPVILARDAWHREDPILGRAATLLTIHNPSYQGKFGRETAWQLGLPSGETAINLLAEGIERATLVNTVSSGFADEVRTPEHGWGLDGELRAKGNRFIGILNGLDTEDWDPATDTVIAAPFSRSDVSGKARCRADLLSGVGFDAGDPAPVLGMVGRLDPQKGFDILTRATPALLSLGARLVVLGSGDPDLAAGLRGIASERPDRVALVEAFDRQLARRIYAGCDMLLMPSRFEPCGLAQMIALRYGTPPIVHATGGLRDTVIDEHDAPGQGTGWGFRHPTADALAWAAGQAMACYRRGDAWRGVVRRGMALDFGWTRSSAPRYVEAYRRAVAEGAPGGQAPDA